MPNFLLVSRYVRSPLVCMCSMVFVSLNSFYRRNNYCMEDSFRWCGILFLSALTRFAVASMTVSSRVTVGFVIYLYLNNNVPETLFARVSFVHRFQQR